MNCNANANFSVPNKPSYIGHSQAAEPKNGQKNYFLYLLVQNGPLCRQSKEVLEALLQFMKLFPYMSGGGVASKTPIYAFGESYGGSYVISLAKVYLNYRCVVVIVNRVCFISDSFGIGLFENSRQVTSSGINRNMKLQIVLSTTCTYIKKFTCSKLAKKLYT